MSMNPAAALAVPFLRPEEIYFVFFDRTAQGLTEIVRRSMFLRQLGRSASCSCLLAGGRNPWHSAYRSGRSSRRRHGTGCFHLWLQC